MDSRVIFVISSVTLLAFLLFTTMRPVSEVPTPSPTRGPPLTAIEAVKAQLADLRRLQDKGVENLEGAIASLEERLQDRPEMRDGLPILSRSLLASRAWKGYVMVTFTDNNYMDFTLNWVYHVRQAGITYFLVAAMDRGAMEALMKADVPSFMMTVSGPSLEQTKGDHVVKAGRNKMSVALKIMRMGFHIIVSDVDTVWLRNPTDHFLQFPEADILASSDYLGMTEGGRKEILEIPSECRHVALNLGVVLFRSSSVQLVEELDDTIRNDTVVWDQHVFNELLRRGWDATEVVDRYFASVYDKKLVLGILPTNLFTSGHTFFVQRQHESLGSRPYVVHTTYTFGNAHGKRHRLREAMLWNDAPDYYNRNGGYVSFDLHIPEDLRRIQKPNGKAGLRRHFDLVHHQLRQIREGLAIAAATGRALVFPEILCAYDRAWYPHDGIFPGTPPYVLYPFRCPLDFVLELHVMEDPNVKERIAFREHSFLLNPRIPKEVNESVRRIAPSDTPAGGFSEEQLREMAPPRILHFTNIVGAFKGFASETNTTWFETTTALFTSVWCCAAETDLGGPPGGGHVPYDFWFDKWPRRDKFGKEWTGPWEIIFPKK